MQANDFAQHLAQHAQNTPHAKALQGEAIALSYADLQHEISTFNLPPSTAPVAFAVSNHPAWVVFDLAALFAQITLVPLPFYFTDSQFLHAMIDAGAQTLVTDNPERFSQLLGDFIVGKSTLKVAGKLLMQYTLRVPPKSLPAHTVKITYTSGTTGSPKGVCLGAQAMLNVAQSIALQANLQAACRHLCVLPLATLLENIAGVYATLLAGGTVHVLPSEVVGFSGTQLNAARFHAALASSQANTVILIPALLQALLATLQAGASPLAHLQFVAVGGAHVPRDLLTSTQALGLPVFEGYGLSESASVVALNTQQAHKIGSVGKLLAHVQIKLATDGEILVQGASYLGYTGEAAHKADDWLATGDIGEIDADGFLYIRGRKKHIFITAYGRNVNPEWVENALLNAPQIAQACVFGEAKPSNTALLVLHPHAQTEQLQAAIAAVNQTLPDYAQVEKWLIVAPFSLQNGQLTHNDRLKRDTIWREYQTKIEALYEGVT